MPAILKELQEKREKLRNEIRKQADAYNERKEKRKDAPEQELWPDESRNAWDQANKDYDSVMNQIRQESEAQEVDRRLKSLDEDDRLPANRGKFDPNADLGRRSRDRQDSGDEDSPEQTRHHHALALQGWARAGTGIELTDEHRKAMKKTNLRGKNIAMQMSRTEDLEAQQAAFRSHHHTLAYRALTTGTGSSGGYTVPTGFINNLEIAMLAFNGVEQAASIISTTSGNDLPWPTANDTGNEGEIVGENGDASTEADPSFGEVLFKAYKFSSKLVKVPFELLEDSAFNFARVLGAMLGERIGRHAQKKFTIGAGSGSSEPNGLVTAATVGKTAALTNAITADELIDLQHSVDPSYRMGNGVGFMLHDTVLRDIRKLKDDNGQYLWVSGISAGMPDTLLGERVFWNQHMASTLAADAKPVLYGDLSKYGIRRVNRLRLLRANERYIENDQVGFIAFIRQDGNLVDAGTNPVKVLQMASS